MRKTCAVSWSRSIRSTVRLRSNRWSESASTCSKSKTSTAWWPLTISGFTCHSRLKLHPSVFQICGRRQPNSSKACNSLGLKRTWQLKARSSKITRATRRQLCSRRASNSDRTIIRWRRRPSSTGRWQGSRIRTKCFNRCSSNSKGTHSLLLCFFSRTCSSRCSASNRQIWCALLTCLPRCNRQCSTWHHLWASHSSLFIPSWVTTQVAASMAKCRPPLPTTASLTRAIIIALQTSQMISTTLTRSSSRCLKVKWSWTC